MRYSIKIQREVFTNLLNNIWKGDKPLCRLFATNKKFYLYDTGTNKILNCNKVEFDLLNRFLLMNIDDAINLSLSEFNQDKVLRAMTSIEQAIKKENILKITKITDFNLYPNYATINEFIKNNLRMAHLEITEKCNMRCGYCIYGDQFEYEKRKHGNRNMSEETAFSAVDYLLNHSKDQDKPTIGFYGGEPLLNFHLIKKTVDYAKKKSNNRIVFTITTNATLMTPEIADFLYHNNISVLVSLDGPKDIHDSWRRDINDKGSFDRTINGLKLLAEAYNKDIHKIGVNCVFAPPYSMGKADEIESFFKSLDWFPNDLRISITYPTEGSVPKKVTYQYRLNIKPDFSLLNWAKAWYLSEYGKNKSMHLLAKNVVERNLVGLVKRRINPTADKSAYLNGCCIPGARKIFVTATGRIRVCERISGAPDLGDIKNGINMKKIKEIYIDDYSRKSILKCSKCWMAKSCSICYAQVFKNDEINMAKKDRICKRRLINADNTLGYLCSLLEINPKGLDYLEKYEFS